LHGVDVLAAQDGLEVLEETGIFGSLVGGLDVDDAIEGVDAS
jgi:hypothetical protein